MKHSFDYCALRYLLMWERDERRLHLGMQGEPSNEALRRSLHYFRISRNFKGIRETQKLKPILAALAVIAKNPTSSPIPNVDALAIQFERDFGQYNLSAASKLLWLRFRHPYIIYDVRAVAGLRRLECRFASQVYAEFCTAWHSAYNEYQRDIENATDRLAGIRMYFTAWHRSDESLRKLTSQPWFRERVFDIFLWELGGKE